MIFKKFQVSFDQVVLFNLVQVDSISLLVVIHKALVFNLIYFLLFISIMFIFFDKLTKRNGIYPDLQVTKRE